MEEVSLQQLPVSTAKRLLAKAVAAQILVKEEDGYRKLKGCHLKG